MQDADTPTFLGWAAPGGDWSLDFPSQVRVWMAHLAGRTGCEIALTAIRADEEHTRAQENGFHAMIRPWAKAIGVDVDDLKFYLLAYAFGTKAFVDPVTGEERTQLAEPSSSRLSKPKYSELIERSMEAASKAGQILVAPDEYRQIQQKARERDARLIARGVLAPPDDF